jgi:hypothetical protein
VDTRESLEKQRQHIDWRVPPGPPRWLHGNGATMTEVGLVWATIVAGVPMLAVVAWNASLQWEPWLWVLSVFVLIDVLGGVTANALGTAKRLYGRQPTAEHRISERIAYNHTLFAIAHFHAFLIVAFYGDGEWAWAGYWYLTTIGGVIAVSAAPVYLQRAVGLGSFALVITIGSTLDGPAGMAWVGPLLALKLIVAHAITESPFRPLPASTR